MQPSYKNLQRAERATFLSLGAYILISCTKIAAGWLFNSASLRADGFNNLTDVISSLLVIIGLKIAQKPVDHNHPYGHWKFETVASLLTSFIMSFVGLEVLKKAVYLLWTNQHSTPSYLSSIVGLLSGIIMLGVYIHNKRLAKEIDSLGLQATAKDNLSDALISFSTALAIFATILGLSWLDNVMAVIVGLLIGKTAIEIFISSVFELTDGFPAEKLDQIEPIILSHPEVQQIGEMKARRYGANIYLDLTILMNPDLTVYRSHQITEEIELKLREEYSIPFIDIHVEPFLPQNDVNSSSHHSF